jgi:flavorubredoxin
MHFRKIQENIFFGGAIDWDRRLFDSLIPLPDGTSYNAYLIKGSQKTALLDTVDPAKTNILLEQLKDIEKIDYIIAHHVEQDHSGSIPCILEKYPSAKVIISSKGKQMIIEHLHIPEEKIIVVNDQEKISLGDLTLRFIYTPWVHWPETMITYLEERQILFTCDFFGSHLATTEMYVPDEAVVYEAAKRYYAEIMMPFRNIIKNNLEKIKDLPVKIIAPSHGPIYNKPSFIIDAYKEWISDKPKNLVVIPFVSMHGSTKIMVEYLINYFAINNITAIQFDLSVVDLGKLAISLVDAATLILGTPTVHAGPHPAAIYAAYLANALKPKLKFVSIVGSYGWGGKTIEQISATISNLKAEVIPPVLCKGLPTSSDINALTNLGNIIKEKHKSIGVL